MTVVTVSRRYGAGGRRVAGALAQVLGFKLVDRELVEQAAVRAGVDPEVAEHLDERTPSLIEEMGLALAAAHPELGVTTARLDDRALADGIARVVRSLAEAGSYVILGRGGQAILQGHPRAFHVQVTGTLDDRTRHVAEWQSMDERSARDLCKQRDAERHAFVRRFYGADLNDPLLYHLICNTSRLSFEGAAQVAAAGVRATSG